METERSNFGKPSKPKGGKDSTMTVLTAAGAAMVGAGAAVAATEWNNDEPVEAQPVDVAPEENTPETTTTTTPQTAPQQEQQSSPAHDIQPVDGGQTSDVTSTQSEEVQPDPNKEDEPYNPVDDVDPDLIAQEIVAIEVDPNDIDVADVLTIDNIDTYYFEDGSELPVALVHTADNSQYLMVDIDDDMTFDMIFDLEGNPIAQVEGNLTMSDVIDMFDETGGELAFNAEQIEQELAGTAAPVEDIIDTSDMAMVHEVSEEEYVEVFEEEAYGLTGPEELAEAETGDEEDTIEELDA